MAVLAVVDVFRKIFVGFQHNPEARGCIGSILSLAQKFQC
jgi:hypothetical protein